MVSLTDRNPVCGPILALILIGSLVIIAHQSSAQEVLKILPPPEQNGTTAVTAIETEPGTTEMYPDPEESASEAGIVRVRLPIKKGANRVGELRAADKTEEVAGKTTVDPPQYWS